MKIVIAQMQHETNTFSPVPTPLEAFGPNGPYFGADALEARKGTATAMAAYLDLAAKAGAQIVTPVAGWANPSGPVDGAAYDQMCDPIMRAACDGCDTLLLDLHGAMVIADRTDDGEGALLEKLRKTCPDLPIAVSLDLHANVTERMVRNCNVLTGYRTYPHVDQYESGLRAGSILLRMIRDEIHPIMAWGNVPVLAQTLRQNTAEGAMKAMVETAGATESGDVLAATAFGGFPMADIYEAGLSAVVVADSNGAAATASCKAILQTAWTGRNDFLHHGIPLEEAIAQAKRLAESSGGPVLLLDHADNCASGATQDTMYVLREALRQGLTGIAVGPLRDADTVAKCVEAGIGARVTLAVGGKTDMPSVRRKGEPLMLSGTIRTISDGEYTITGPQFTGMRCSMGTTALLDTGAAQVIVTERGQEPWDRAVFEIVGVDPRRQRYLLLKSRMYYRPIFLPIAKGVVLCDAPGVASSDWTQFEYRKLRRPIFPLDQNVAY